MYVYLLNRLMVRQERLGFEYGTTRIPFAICTLVSSLKLVHSAVAHSRLFSRLHPWHDKRQENQHTKTETRD